MSAFSTKPIHENYFAPNGQRNHRKQKNMRCRKSSTTRTGNIWFHGKDTTKQKTRGNQEKIYTTPKKHWNYSRGTGSRGVLLRIRRMTPQVLANAKYAATKATLYGYIGMDRYLLYGRTTPISLPSLYSLPPSNNITSSTCRFIRLIQD